MPSSSETKAYNVLDRFRTEAANSRQYLSETTRAEISRTPLTEKNRMSGKLMFAKLFYYLGLDGIVIAGTGAGKTMSFIMPLLVDSTKQKMVVIISTLNDFEHIQVRR
jgi:L-asparaginase/Glu-tRNA(Gln) amidotransferase subunit D